MLVSVLADAGDEALGACYAYYCWPSWAVAY